MSVCRMLCNNDKKVAWEPSYAERVEAVRAAETNQLQAAGRLKGANMGISFGASPVICLATFLTFFFSSPISDFTADRVFVTLSLFGVIRLTMTLFFPFAVEGTSEIRVSLSRIQAFLLLDNYQRLNVTRDATSAAAAAAAKMTNGANGVTAVSKEHAHAAAKRRLNFLAECTSLEEVPKAWPQHTENPHVELKGIWAWWLRQGQPLDAYSVQPTPALHPALQVNGVLSSSHVPSLLTSSSAATAVPLPTVPESIAAFPPLRPLLLDHRLPLPGLAGSLPPSPHEPIAPPKSRAPGPPSLRYSSPLPPPPPPPLAPAPQQANPNPPSVGTFVDLSGEKKTVPSTPSQIQHNSAGPSPTGKAGRKDLPTLIDVSMTVRAGELACVVGPVGAGKSSVLMTILSELTPHRGTVSVRGSTAYAAQQPWIMSGTVKSNVLMGLPYDEEKFQRAVFACALEKDIAGFSDGISVQYSSYRCCIDLLC
jgi:ABC-type multidrug transport system fused ATPase/permease subunit